MIFFNINFLYFIFYEILLLLSMNILLWVWKISSTDFYSKKSCLYEQKRNKKKLNKCERKRFFLYECVYDVCWSMYKYVMYIICAMLQRDFSFIYYYFKVFVTLFDGRGRRKRKQVIQISLINVETLMV